MAFTTRILGDCRFPRFEGKRLNSPNDIVLGPDCAFYPGTDGLMRLLVKDFGAPNSKQLGTIVLPENATILAWGDADLCAPYIAATTSVYRLKIKTRGFVPCLH